VKFKVLDEKENPMLKRKEMLMSLDYEGKSTPSKADLQKLLSEQLNANIESVEISKILSEIGRTMGKAWVKLWQEKKVPIYSELKKKEEKPKKAPKPEQPKEEPKAEVKKEEPKQEEQKEKEEPMEKKVSDSG
jgi:ribosomal protein S24E